MLTLRQLVSLTRDRHLSVRANAGSGKTRVLVERYVDILLCREAEVGEVVALTFTEKAASELKRKVAEHLTQSLAGSTDPGTTHRVEEVREQLSGAFIGTIHSFCARLLHEYPVEAGVDASFTVVEGLEQHAVLQEALKETFRAVLREPAGEAGRGRLVEAVRALGKRRVINIIRMLVDRRDRLERLVRPGGLYSRADEEIVREWDDQIRRHVLAVLTRPALRASIERVGAVLDGKSAGEVRALIRDGAPEESPLILAGRIWKILTLLLKQDGGLYRTVASAAAEATVATPRGVLARAREEVLPYADMVFAGADSRHRELLACSRTLLGVAQECLVRYGEKKLDRGKLDFEDLQLHLRALLQKEEIRTQLAARFRFVMVDEYQDTNELQYELLRPLLQDLRAGNLFIVGDPKQSIYSFRGADVAVFERTCRDLAAANGPAAGPGRIVLEESFRPLRDLAAFVNLVFHPLMGGEDRDEGEYEVGYEPIVRARRNRAPGRVELLLSGLPEDGGEPERIARAIGELVGSGYPVHDGNESPHPVRYADIAVLLRSRLPLPDLELALARAEIPYVVTGGTGYFQTQDILDFHSYLRFLQNDGDDVALLGILRSPLFTVSDTELFEAVVHGRRGTLWQDLLAQRERLGPRLAGVLRSLQEDLEICSRLSAPDVLTRVIARTKYQSKIGGTPRAAQAAANLEKLRSMARSFDLQGFTTLFDFTLRLGKLIREEEEEGQGNIDTQTDAVQIMTVHAAKGLEFPVVVLPGLHRTFRYDTEPFFHERFGLAFARAGEEGGDFPLTAFLRGDARRKTIAEEKRIFYVACTRARDVLLLSAETAGKRSGVSWLGWLLEGLGVLEIPREPLTFECTTGVLERGEEEYRAGVERHSLTVVVRTPSPAAATHTVPPAPAHTVERPSVFADPIPTHDAGEIFSATRIRVYRDCPAHYYLRYVLGMPQQGFSARGGEADELVDAEFPPDLRGRIFHAAMESIDHLALADLPSAIHRLLALEVPPHNPSFARLVEEVQRMVTGVLSSPFWQQVRGGTSTRAEFTISAVLGDDFLSGTMDRVYRGSDGRWHVLDYKTDRVDDSTIAERAEEYWPQLEFYALLVHHFFDAAPVVAELLFAAVPHRVLCREYSSGDLTEARKEIASVIARIKSSTFPPVHTSCPRCPFASSCPWSVTAG